MKIAFCVVGITPRILERTEFYRQDFEILKSLGHEVTFISNPLKLGRNFDLAFVWWWNYLWAWGVMCRILGLPIITTGVLDQQATLRMTALKRRLRSWGVRFSDLNIAISKDEMESLPSEFGERCKSLRYSPLAIDTSVYSPGGKLHRNNEPFTILNVAWQQMANIRRKMLPELLEAFARLSQTHPEVRLILAGPSEDGGPFLQQKAKELGVHSKVDFPGEISRERKVELLRTCSLYCQVSRHEGFGLAAGEALACGAPVLTSKVAAVPEVVGDCGRYVQELTVDGIYEGLKWFMANPEESATMAKGGVARVRELFSVERRRNDLAKFIAEVV